MTVKLLTPRKISGIVYPAGALVTLDSGTETGLIASKEADSNTTGGFAYTPPADPESFDEAQAGGGFGFWKVVSWANRPDAAVFANAIIFISDINGGAFFRSTGARWVPLSDIIPIGQQNTAVTAPADTNENTLYSLTIPGGLMGPNDSLRVSTGFSHTSSANSKTMRVKLAGGGSGLAVSAVTNAASGIVCVIANRNSQSAQHLRNFSTTGGTGVNAYDTVNTAASFQVLVTGQKTLGTETLALESVLVELIRGA